jgi:hypothetical protein
MPPSPTSRHPPWCRRLDILVAEFREDLLVVLPETPGRSIFRTCAPIIGELAGCEGGGYGMLQRYDGYASEG